MADRIPVVGYLVIDGAEPHLVAQRCASCGALFLDRRNGCAACGSVDFEASPLATEGTVRSFTIVHRSAPGVLVPYVSVVVDLDGGGLVKSTLVGTDGSSTSVVPGLRVRLATFTADVDDRGVEAIAFRFEATGEVAA